MRNAADSAAQEAGRAPECQKVGKVHFSLPLLSHNVHYTKLYVMKIEASLLSLFSDLVGFFERYCLFEFAKNYPALSEQFFCLLSLCTHTQNRWMPPDAFLCFWRCNTYTGKGSVPK